MIKWIFFKYL